MLLTVTATAPAATASSVAPSDPTSTSTANLADATELGYLLHKHPDRVQSFDLPVGRATVFYPEATERRCTAALVLEVDPIDLVRRRGKGGGHDAFALGQYVNDRPFAASFLLAVALGRVFGSALNGRCDARPQLVGSPLPLQIRVPALPAKGDQWRDGAQLVRDLFDPLGWKVTIRQVDLAEGLSGFDWGPAPYVDLTLTGDVRLADALNHLYVLLPVLDGAKHYWVGPQEVDKLLRRGEGWLAAHPDRDLITRRYLAAQRRLVDDATDRLVELDDRPPGDLETLGELWPAGADDDHDDVDAVAADGATQIADAPDHDVLGAAGGVCGEGPRGEARAGVAPAAIDMGVSGIRPLKVLRREAVLAALAEVGAARVVDLGCG